MLFQTEKTKEYGKCHCCFFPADRPAMELKTHGKKGLAVGILNEQVKRTFSPETIQFKNVRETPFEHHVFYQQQLQGYSISGAWLRVDHTHEGQLTGFHSRLFSDLVLRRAAKFIDYGDKLSEDAAVSRARTALGEGEDASALDASLCLKLRGKTPRLTWKIALQADGAGRSWEIYVDATSGRVVEKDKTHFFAIGTVFFPNPMITTGDFSMSANAAVPTTAYRSVTLDNLASSGFLDGRFASTVGTPNRVRRTDGVFRFTRDQPGFAETMAYFFADATQQRIQRLNFRHANPGQVRIVVHTAGGSNSVYDVRRNAVYLASGGVPDWEDAEIIVHEYCHAVHSVINPPFGRGAVSVHLAEGFSDYFALSQFADAKPVAIDGCFAMWNATGNPGRPACTRRIHPHAKLTDFTITRSMRRNNNLVAFWASVLWDIRSLLGADRGDSIALGHLYRIQPGFSFQHAAQAIIEYNNIAYDRRHEPDLLDIFRRRAII